jgi:hypothetical protein
MLESGRGCAGYPCFDTLPSAFNLKFRFHFSSTQPNEIRGLSGLSTSLLQELVCLFLLRLSGSISLYSLTEIMTTSKLKHLTWHNLG